MANNPEFELTIQILNDHFCITSPDVLKLEEHQGDKLDPQIVSICCRKDIPHRLYRFDGISDDFLPFFRNTNAPKQLRSFCDYIFLYVRQSRLYIMLIEMKRGKSTGAAEQIQASKCFMEYIINTAMRIKDINGFSEFVPSSIHYRCIVLKRSKTSKQPTMYRRNFGPINDDTIIQYTSTGEFLPNEVC